MMNTLALAVTALFTLLAFNGSAQSIILVNGEPTEVLLDGDDIKKIVRDRIVDYMHEYGQTVDDEFKQANLRFENENQESNLPEKKATTDATSEAPDYAIHSLANPDLRYKEK